MSAQADVVGGPAAGSAHRLEEYYTAVVKGTHLMKFGRHGAPKQHFFRLAADRHYLEWESRGSKKRVNLLVVHRVLRGQFTPVFLKNNRNAQAKASPELCFSLLYRQRGEDRSLDLVCKDADEFGLWFNGIKLIIEDLKSKKALPPGVPPDDGVVVGIPQGALGFPPKDAPPGDCYMWGGPPAGEEQEARAVLGDNTPLNLVLPRLVPSAERLDIEKASCGPHHFACITRNGHLYTWGNGSCGRLGLGSVQHVNTPATVYGLCDMASVGYMSCGETSTAAILKDGSLFTWGGGLSGQLGHDNITTQYLPRRVERGLYGVHIVQVSCGPYHTAAVSNLGILYTWGDGLCGKLGHGDQESKHTPQPVEALYVGEVQWVCCGWWHTAAVVMANEHRGGSLYTWGGDFTWGKDHNRGCLGNGSTNGSSTPQRVEGDLDELDVKHVACGLNLTVAQTSDGLVFQMGATGAGDTFVKWEGAKLPEEVKGGLSGYKAEEIACGRKHVCVVATPVTASGRADEARRRTVLFAWGKGDKGQLGLGYTKDHTSPQVVEALTARRIQQVCCGGDFTLAVCRYDARMAAAASIMVADPLPATPQGLSARKPGNQQQPFGFKPAFSASKRDRTGSAESNSMDPKLKRPSDPVKRQGKQVVRATSSRSKSSAYSSAPFYEFCPTQAGPSPSPSPDPHGGEPGFDDGSIGTDVSVTGAVSPRQVTAAEVITPRHHSTLSADCAFPEYAEPNPTHFFDSTPAGGDWRLLPQSASGVHNELLDSGANAASTIYSDESPRERGRRGERGSFSENSTAETLGTSDGRPPRDPISDNEMEPAECSPRRAEEIGGSRTIPLGPNNALPSTTKMASRARLLSKRAQMMQAASESWGRPGSVHASSTGHSEPIAMDRWSDGHGEDSGSGQGYDRGQTLSDFSRGMWDPKEKEGYAMERRGQTMTEFERRDIFRPPGSTGTFEPPKGRRSSHEMHGANVTYRGITRDSWTPRPVSIPRPEDSSHHQHELLRWRTAVLQTLSEVSKKECDGKTFDVRMELTPLKDMLQKMPVLGNLSEERAAVESTGTSIHPEEPKGSNLADLVKRTDRLVDIAKGMVKDASKVDEQPLAAQDKDGGIQTVEVQEVKNMREQLLTMLEILEDMRDLLKCKTGNQQLPAEKSEKTPEHVPASESEAAIVKDAQAEKKDLKQEEKQVQPMESASDKEGHRVERNAQQEPITGTPESEAAQAVEASEEVATESGHTRRRSLDLIRPGDKNGTPGQQWIETVDPGVSVIFQRAPGGVTKIKKIRFSKRKFTADRAQNWWQENQQRLVQHYNLVPGASLGDQSPFGKAGFAGIGDTITDVPNVEDQSGRAVLPESHAPGSGGDFQGRESTAAQPSAGLANSKPGAEDDDPDQSVQNPVYAPDSNTLPSGPDNLTSPSLGPSMES
ncbi:unnamed protein product [Ostreobium quekettii]|uniref:BRX domain-containing protein n=1 Tax=Ostreobium quekettii TaxID=121088 RepID=A0A8S1J8A8_9CHLO|nr:unnamed protein product [Ostreobium quekettii]|eukprot:evm.model.scf_1909.2 EVM.evm.TU.scf_1909.2   scf_1909:6368-18098(-)